MTSTFESISGHPLTSLGANEDQISSTLQQLCQWVVGYNYWRGNFERDRFRTQQFDRLTGRSKALHNPSK